QHGPHPAGLRARRDVRSGDLITLVSVPSTRPRAARRPLTRNTAVRMVLAAVVAAAVSVGYQAAYRRLHFPLPSEVPTVVASLVTIAVTACAAVAVLRRPGLVTACGWVLPALLSTAVQSWLLTGTRFYMNGLGGDQQFRTAFLTRMTDSPALADAVYA